MTAHVATTRSRRLTILILSRNVRQGSAAKSTSRGGTGIVAWFFKEGLAQKKRVVCKTASRKTQPVVGWTFRKAVVQAPAFTGGVIFRGGGKNSHGMLPFGIIYRSGIHDGFTLDKSANPALACWRGKARALKERESVRSPGLGLLAGTLQAA
jgi:hypothetical protein